MAALTLTAPTPGLYRRPPSLLEADSAVQHPLPMLRRLAPLKATADQSSSQPMVTAPYRISGTAHDRISGLRAAFSDALVDARSLVEAEELEEPSADTWTAAFNALHHFLAGPFAELLDVPLISPMRFGGLSAEWHASGLNIELRFRRPGDVYAVIEDARGEIESYWGSDPDLFRAAEAIAKLAARSG
jgi:hypothetical protein